MIAIPALDYISATFVARLLKLVNHLHDEKVDFTVYIKSGTLVHCARDWLASIAIQEGFTHVLWLDADMVFEETVLEDLQFSGKPFVTAICHSRRPPYNTCLFTSIREKVERWDDKIPYPTSAFRIAGCGMACVLMDVQILRDIFNSYRTCFIPLKDYGEDLAFCLRAAALGHDIYAEPSTAVGHIGHTIIYPEDHWKYIKSLEDNNGIN